MTEEINFNELNELMLDVNDDINAENYSQPDKQIESNLINTDNSLHISEIQESELTKLSHKMEHSKRNRDEKHRHHRHNHHRHHKDRSRTRHRSKHEHTREPDSEDEVSVDRTKTSTRSKYVIDAAEEGGSSDDDSLADDNNNDDIINDDDGDEIKHNDKEDGTDNQYYTEPFTPQNKFIFHEGEDELSAEELGREYEQRLQDLRAATQHQRTKHRTHYSSGAEHQTGSRQVTSSLRYAAHLLPQETDPKVFAVKCRPRMTRLLVARIVNKCYSYRVGRNFEHKRVDLGIISVFCLDHVKEYIYVEAYRKLFVEHALNGLDGLFRFNITVVDPSELMQMMEHRPSNEKVKVGAFVRLRQRPYRNDLAQVTEVHQDGLHITCKLIPRENFVGKPFNKSATRLQQRFFVPSLAVGVEKRGESYRWGDLRFDSDGYLLKVVSIRMVVSGTRMEGASTEELARFYRNNRERVREVVAAAQSGSAVRGGLEEAQIGDCVRVISGQLTGTVGTITNLFANNHTALLECTIPGQSNKVNLRVELNACTRHFTEGMHVIVEKGDHAGESGTVVRTCNDTVLLFPDRTSASTELVIRANDCHQSNLVGSFGHSYGVWQLFDLVALSDTNVAACIIRLSRQNVDVLTERNERRTLTYAQIKAISRGSRKTTDRMQNPLVRGSEVIIQRTPSTPFNLGGESGRIEQVFNRTLFVNCRSMLDNTGIVALDAGCVLLTGGRTTTKQISAPRELPAQLRRPHNATMADISASFRSSHPEWASTSEWNELSSMPQE